MAMNVGDWLRSLGLGKYEATFRDSEIDSDILHELTESDLEKLGLPLGHRKRLLKVRLRCHIVSPSVEETCHAAEAPSGVGMGTSHCFLMDCQRSL